MPAGTTKSKAPTPWDTTHRAALLGNDVGLQRLGQMLGIELDRASAAT